MKRVLITGAAGDIGAAYKTIPRRFTSIERLRPLAWEVAPAGFKQTMETEVETAFGKALEQQSKRVR